MIRNSVLISIMLFVATLLTAGCRRIGPADGEVGDLVLRFSTGTPATKGNPAEGDQFNNLLVVVTDMSNKPIEGKWAYEPSLPATDSYEIPFKGLTVGSYKVFAFANIDHDTWGHGISQPNEGSPKVTVEDAVKSLCVEGNLSKGLEIDRTLSLPVPNTTPVPEYPTSTGMFLTGQQEVFVGVKSNLGEVKLLRPVVRLKVLVRNHSGKTIKVNSLGFGKINPTQGTYMIGRDAEGVPVVPGDPNHPENDYSVLENIVPSPTNILDKGEEEFKTLLFENAIGSGYRMSGAVEREGVTQTIGSYRFTFFAEWDGNYGGTGGKYLTVTHTTDPEDRGGETDTRWLVFDKGGEHESDMIPFRTISNTKPRRQYILTVDLTDWIDYFTSTDKGFYVLDKSDNKYWGKNNGSKKLVLGAAYNLKDPGTGSVPSLSFEWEPDGARLKRIDPETNQATPITFMRRNQELTVVLNVYYETATGEFGIKVDNTYWGDEAHKSDHIFR